jgi:hypothetical protein
MYVCIYMYVSNILTFSNVADESRRVVCIYVYTYIHVCVCVFSHNIQDGPAETYWWEDETSEDGVGRKQREVWVIEGRQHRDNAPAVVEWHADGAVRKEVWRVRDEWHREDGPAETHWYAHGQKKKELWFVCDRSHRMDGPAERHYHPNGRVASEVWRVDGKTHRCVYVYICMYMCTYVCMYVYICMYVCVVDVYAYPCTCIPACVHVRV